MTAEPNKPYRGALPRPTPETKPFWDGAKQHKLMLPWCKACGLAHFFPRNCCPHCFAFDLEWRQASGRGKLHTYVINHKPARGFEDKVPYVIAVVDTGWTRLVSGAETSPCRSLLARWQQRGSRAPIG